MPRQDLANRMLAGWIAARKGQVRDAGQGAEWLEGFDLRPR